MEQRLHLWCKVLDSADTATPCSFVESILSILYEGNTQTEHISIGTDMDNGYQHKLACKMGRTRQNILELLYNELRCVVSSAFNS